MKTLTCVTQAVSLIAKKEGNQSSSVNVSLGEKVIIDKVTPQVENLCRLGIVKIREANLVDISKFKKLVLI